MEGSGLGDLFLTGEEIAVAVEEAELTGHQVVIHAIGDRAVRAAQDGIAAGLDGRPNTLRHRIDHNVVVSADLIPRYAEIGIQPVLFGYLSSGVIQPGPGTCEPAPRNAFYSAFEGNTRLLLDELPGQRVAWHGDDPWVGPVSPFRELYSMVTRIRRGATFFCPPPPWHLQTRITPAEGLTMMTTSSAYALFREKEVGMLPAGHAGRPHRGVGESTGCGTGGSLGTRGLDDDDRRSGGVLPRGTGSALPSHVFLGSNLPRVAGPGSENACQEL